MRYNVYTDGSCRNNGSVNSVGAYGYIIVVNDQIINEHADVQVPATNQQMELRAALEACKYAETLLVSTFDEVYIYTDSAYLHNCKTQKWYEYWRTHNWKTKTKTLVANSDIWKELIPYFENPQFTFLKVPGHADNKYNNIIDKKVQSASLEAQRSQNGSNN